MASDRVVMAREEWDRIRELEAVRAEALLGPYAISAALAVMQERKLNVRREDVADALAAAWRTAVGTDEKDLSA